MTKALPELALDKHAALLGMTGSGKTSVAKSGIVEPDLEAGRRVIIVDPTGAWWGLRLAKSGKSKGFGVYIFGGDHGDYPLKAANAKLLAEAFATSSDSAIFDTSQMTVTERTTFFTEFAETFRRKNKGWVRFVIDEAHLFMPQQGAKAGGGVPAMLHAGNNLVSLGRSRGLRIVMISQRAAKLHKDSLTQAHSLIAMQLMSPQDRGAINDWVSDQADPAKGKEIIASLPSLAPGEAWVWAPQAKYLERVKFPRPSTFDSSSAPEDDGGEGPTLAPINLDALKGKLATVEAEVKANDPKALKAEIAQLKRTMADAARQGQMPDAGAAKDAEIAGYHRGMNEAWPKGWRAGYQEGFGEGFFSAVKSASALKPPARIAIPDPDGGPELPKVAPRPVQAVSAPVPRPVAPRSNGHDNFYTGPQMKVLRSLAMWLSLGHATPTKEMVAAVAGYSPTSGGYANLLGTLRTMGAVDYPSPGLVNLQSSGIETPSRDEGRDLLLSVLSGPQRKIVDAALGGETHTKDAIAEATGYSPTSGGYANLLGSLRTIGIIDYPQPGHVALSDWARELL